MGRRRDGLYHPLGVLKPFAPEAWIVDGSAIPFYGMPYPTRMCAIRLPSGRIWLHSPIRPDERLIEEIEALGPIGFLVAPNPLHYAFLPAWALRFPEAEVHAAPGVVDRAARHGIAFPPCTVLGDEAPGGWAGTIRQRLVPGHAFLKEVVFFHDPTHTLVLTDLIENFEPKRLGPLMQIATRLGGIRAPHGQTPRDAQWTWRDRAAAARVLDEVMGWEPARVVLAHGAPIERDVADRLRRAFAWLK